MALLRTVLNRVFTPGTRKLMQRSNFVPNVTPVLSAAVPRRAFDYYVTPDEDLSEIPVPGSLVPGSFLTEEQQLKRGKWPSSWNKGIRARLPEHYKRRFVETFSREPIPVHYKPNPNKYELDKNGQRIRVQNVPVPVLYPKECDEGLWGGEGIVKGFRKKHDDPMKPRSPKIWKPAHTRRILYSEILDQHLEITVTPRTLDLIDEAYGFDFYLLKTHQVDLKSKLGMRLKRAMLRTLHKRTMYPGDKKKQQEIYDRYKKFLIPEEEIEWLGLTLTEAEEMLQHQEALERPQLLPQKEVFVEKLVADLQSKTDAEEDDEGWLAKLNPFKKDETDKN